MKLSVIVATRNRAHAITGCLDSIASSLANASPLDAEIVVVDNGSEDDTSARVQKWARANAFSVRLLFEPAKGLSRARNRALKATQGDLLAFTDDDCRLSNEYVSQLLSYDANDTDLVLRGGQVKLGDPTDLPLSIKTDPVSARWNRRMQFSRNVNLFDGVRGCNMVLGCNMTMRRAVVELLGPFDERLGAGTALPGAEDTDYFFRAFLAGITIEYVPDMNIFHYHGRKTIYEGNRLMRDYMLGTGGLYAKYLFRFPNLCRPFYWDIKNSVKETIKGKNTFLPDIDFSHKDKIIYNALGAIRYLFTCIKF
jgi:glycosyltransferase involved in cell wall biosynthesis